MRYLHGLHCGALSDGYDSTGAALMAERPGLLRNVCLHDRLGIEE